MNTFSPISERMEFECRWLLLFHQSATADRGGEHPFYWAGTTGHRIRTTAGNDCVIRPQEHTQPCTDALRQTHHWSSIHPVSSNSFTKGYDFLYCQSGLFVSYASQINWHPLFLFSQIYLEVWQIGFYFNTKKPHWKYHFELISSCYINVYIADMWGSECLKLVLLFKIPSVQH